MTRTLDNDDDIAMPDTPCACTVTGCVCQDIADAITADGTPLCACCISDCTHVHPDGETPRQFWHPDSFEPTATEGEQA